MRIAPITIPHIRKGGPTFLSDTAICAAITHNDRGSIGACVAFAGMLIELLACRRPPASDWWVTRYVELARQVEGKSRYTPSGGSHQGSYCGPIWRFVQEQVPPAVENEESVLQAGNTWYSGAYLLETVPTVLFILSRHGDDPEEAIVRAVNDTKDNDTVAAIVGAAVGALHGENALPSRWREGLLGRTTANDDGRVFELLDRAESVFGRDDSNRDAPDGIAKPRGSADGGRRTVTESSIGPKGVCSVNSPAMRWAALSSSRRRREFTECTRAALGNWRTEALGTHWPVSRPMTRSWR